MTDPSAEDSQSRGADIGLARLGSRTSLLRKTAYRLLGGRTFRRRAVTADGAFDCYVTPASQLAVLNPRGLKVDPVHAGFIGRWVRERSVVWDVGGNMGLFGLPAALKARQGQVLIFEPDVDLVRNLLKSVASPRNRLLKARVLPLGLSDADGVAEFEICAFGRSMNRLRGVSQWHDPIYVASEVRSVPTFRMDTVAESLPAPDVIKIDVEGAEMKVLRGGRKTIETHRPAMLIEVPDALSAPIVDYFSDLDYVFFDAERGYDTPITTPVWNFVAVAREKL